jgi:hypothetical protein
MSLVVKCEAQNLAEGSEVFRPAPVWVYENCEPATGDEVFVWTTKASADGGGLSMRGTLVEWSRDQLSRNRPGASLTIRIEDWQPQQALTVGDLARYDRRRSPLDIGDGPEVELCRKLLVNSHNKVAHLGADEGDLLRSFFDRLRSEATDASLEFERMVMWAERATRPGQREFSERIRQLYQNRCAVTGCATTAALQAAHIRVQDGVDDNSTSNGILLRADIHLLFDALLITLSEDGSRLELSRRLSDPTYDLLREAVVYMPDAASRPLRANILHHRDRFRHAEAAR